MQEIEKMIQKETFDIVVQYCGSDDCLHDCVHADNTCDAYLVPWT